MTRRARAPSATAVRRRTACRIVTGTSLVLPCVRTEALGTHPVTVALNRICHQAATAASLPTTAYRVVAPPARRPTWAWRASGPARTLSPAVSAGFRLACAAAAVVPWLVVQGPFPAAFAALTRMS